MYFAKLTQNCSFNHNKTKGAKEQEDEPAESQQDQPKVLKLISKQETYESWVNFQKKNQGSFDLIIFTCFGRDTYFKRAAQRKSYQNGGVWIENPMKSSCMFNVHWDYVDQKIDAKKLLSHQFCNHFPETRELTTKSGLTRNMNSITIPGVRPDQFFPRSYDLSDQKQLDLFMIDYNQTSILNILKKHANYFKFLIQRRQNSKNTLKNAQLVQELLQKTKINGDFLQNHDEKVKIKEKLEGRCFWADDPNNQIPNINSSEFGWINQNLLKATLFFCQGILNDMQIELDNGSSKYFKSDHTHDEFFKRNCFKAEYKLPNNLKEALYVYSQINLPFTQRQCETQEPQVNKAYSDNFEDYSDKKVTTIDSSHCHTLESFGGDELREHDLMRIQKLKGWVQVCGDVSERDGKDNVLDLYLVYLTIRMSDLFENNMPQYSCVNGDQNTWIRKPSYNARGNGIFCVNDRSDILNLHFKRGSGPKIIQKYIEKPLLIKNLNPQNASDMRKFDVRQWVLLMSMEPSAEEQKRLAENGLIQTPHPQVYVYKDAYLRLCGKSYDLSKLDDLSRHLSNFSVQKQFKEDDVQINNDLTDVDISKVVTQTTMTSYGGQFLKDAAAQQEFVMSTKDFIDLINDENLYPELAHLKKNYKGGNFSWEHTFNSQIQKICRHVFEKMSEVIDDNQNCFELFGFDFMIDAGLKCWLIEANMSPACSDRQSQPWFQDLIQDMSDGMVNIVEHKVVKTLSTLTRTYSFSGLLNEKIQSYQSGKYKISEDLLNGWQQINFDDPIELNFQQKEQINDQNTPNKITTDKNDFSASQKRPKQKLRVKEMKELNFQEKLKDKSLLIEGFACDIRSHQNTSFLLKTNQAVLFIQRVWRGCRARVDYSYKYIAILKIQIAIKEYLQKKKSIERDNNHQDTLSQQRAKSMTQKQKHLTDINLNYMRKQINGQKLRGERCDDQDDDELDLAERMSSGRSGQSFDQYVNEKSKTVLIQEIQQIYQTEDCRKQIERRNGDDSYLNNLQSSTPIKIDGVILLGGQTIDRNDGGDGDVGHGQILAYDNQKFDGRNYEKRQGQSTSNQLKDTPAPKSEKNSKIKSQSTLKNQFSDQKYNLIDQLIQQFRNNNVNKKSQRIGRQRNSQQKLKSKLTSDFRQIQKFANQFQFRNDVQRQVYWSVGKRRKRPKKSVCGQEKLVDPDLLLEPEKLGIWMVVPTGGSHIHFESGLIIVRNGLQQQNPIEIQDKTFAEREKKVKKYEKLLKMDQNMNIPIELLNKRSVFDIYTNTSNQSGMGQKIRRETILKNLEQEKKILNKIKHGTYEASFKKSSKSGSSKYSHFKDQNDQKLSSIFENQVKNLQNSQNSQKKLNENRMVRQKDIVKLYNTNNMSHLQSKHRILIQADVRRNGESLSRVRKGKALGAEQEERMVAENVNILDGRSNEEIYEDKNKLPELNKSQIYTDQFSAKTLQEKLGGTGPIIASGDVSLNLRSTRFNVREELGARLIEMGGNHKWPNKLDWAIDAPIIDKQVLATQLEKRQRSKIKSQRGTMTQQKGMILNMQSENEYGRQLEIMKSEVCAASVLENERTMSPAQKIPQISRGELQKSAVSYQKQLLAPLIEITPDRKNKLVPLAKISNKNHEKIMAKLNEENNQLHSESEKRSKKFYGSQYDKKLNLNRSSRSNVKFIQDKQQSMSSCE